MVNKTTTAILVDGGFYRKRARALFGKKTPPKTEPTNSIPIA